MSDQCIFCNPDPKALIYNGNDGIVLIDGPARPGHVLVGVKGHYPSLHEVPSDQIAAMMRLAVKASRHIVSKTGAEKTYVVAVGDKDKHFHVHLLPKMAKDPVLGPYVFGDNGWASFLPQQVDEKALQDVKDLLSRVLGRE